MPKKLMFDKITYFHQLIIICSDMHNDLKLQFITVAVSSTKFNMSRIYFQADHSAQYFAMKWMTEGDISAIHRKT